jgi:phage tail sheath protein FI
MPSALSYPGVYIEEIPSGVRTITGVATSITAFVGRTYAGPTDKPMLINSFGDFERNYGGLRQDFPLSYAVRDFYRNGGSKAVIARLYEKKDGNTDGFSTVKVEKFTLKSKSQGAWGNNITAEMDTDVDKDAASRLKISNGSIVFNLKIFLGENVVEKYLNLTDDINNTRYIRRVLTEESNFVTFSSIDLAGTATQKDLNGHVEDAEKNLKAEKEKNPQNADDIKKQEAALAEAKKNSARFKNDETGHDGINLTQLTYGGGNTGEKDKLGLYLLEHVDLFNLLVIPPDLDRTDVPTPIQQMAIEYAVKRRAFVIIDAPYSWKSSAEGVTGFDALNLSGVTSRNAALYFPYIRKANPLRDGQVEDFPPSGAIAGIFARTDTTRGVWKAPAGLDASIEGIQGLAVNLTDLENGDLNQLGINSLRAFAGSGKVVWGARTLRGADRLADEWKYIPVRRTALFIEESLYRGTQWVVFEPNDEPLWAQIRLNIGAFMHNLFRLGAFQGSTPKDAYFVKCDGETTNQTDINSGIVNIVVGFAPLKPAEFVVIKLQQIAGQIDV